MRRPIVFAAFAFAIGVLAEFLFEVELKVLLCSLLFELMLWFGFSIWKKDSLSSRPLLLFLCILLTGSITLQLYRTPAAYFKGAAGRTVKATGTVEEIKRKGDGYQILLKTKEGQILVSCYQETGDYETLAGKTVAVQGGLSLPSPRRNPGCFDYRLYLETQNVHLLLNAKQMQVLGGETKYSAKIRSHFMRSLGHCMDQREAGIVSAMLFGDKSFLDETLYENFQRNGTAHILAVSGLHVGVVYGFFCFMWRGKKGFLFCGFILVLLYAYGALASFSPSVVRAAVMIVIHLFSKVLHRRYDLLSAAAFTFILMLSINPMQLFHIGFQLSFLAIASLGVILPFIKEAYSGILLSGFAIQAGMAPYTAYVFNYISMGGLIGNIPIIFLAGILIPLGVLLVPVSFFSQNLFEWGAAVLEQGCKWIVFLNDLVYAEGRTSFQVVSPSVFLLITYYIGVFLAVSEKGRILFIRKKYRFLLAAGIAILVGAAFLSWYMEDGFEKAEIVFVDVGQGDCLHIKTQEGKHYLIDGGGSRNYDVGEKILKPYLLKNGVKKIDIAFVTHLHTDHYAGIESLAKQGMVEHIAVYDGNRGVAFTGAKPLYLHKGKRIRLGEGVFIEVLYPEKRNEAASGKVEEDENATSLIMKLYYKGTSVMMTGDIDTSGERALIGMNRDLHTDILKIPHHGSKYSSSDALFEAVRPEAAVFQVGKNNFGHPTKEILEKCSKRGIMIYRNDMDGAIGFGGLSDESQAYFVRRMVDGGI